MNDNRDPRDDASYQDAPDDLELALRNATRIELSGGAGERHTLPTTAAPSPPSRESDRSPLWLQSL